MPDTADRADLDYEHGREDDLVFPPDDLSLLLNLARFLEDRPEPGLLIGLDGEQIAAPPGGVPGAPARGRGHATRQGHARRTSELAPHHAGGSGPARREPADAREAETERIDSRFLEPACGSDDFLIQVLRRKRMR